MYIPKAFEVKDKDKIFNFVKDNSFGILFSQDGSQPFATHLPFLLEEKSGENSILTSHMAKSNPHWKTLNNKEVLVVFSGPHSYISPIWYQEPNTVSTWNYVAVHIYGKVKIIENEKRLLEILEQTVRFYEGKYGEDAEMPKNDPFIQGLMKGIVGFELEINRIEGKWKLNQNHSIERQFNTIEGLRKTSDQNANAIANLMEENIK